MLPQKEPVPLSRCYARRPEDSLNSSPFDQIAMRSTSQYAPVIPIA